MLNYSVRVYEKIFRQAVPVVTEEEIDQIVYAHGYYSDENPFYYPDFWNIIAYNNPNLSKENIDQTFVSAVERVFSAENPLDAALRSFYLNDDANEEFIIDRRRQHTRRYNVFIRRIRDENPRTFVDYNEDDVSSLIPKCDYDEMLNYTKHAYEKLIRQAVPDASEEEIYCITHTYATDNPLYYPDLWRKKNRWNNPSESIMDTNKIFVNVVERVLSAENPLDVTIRSVYPNLNDGAVILEEIKSYTGTYKNLVQKIRNRNEDVSDVVSLKSSYVVCIYTKKKECRL